MKIQTMNKLGENIYLINDNIKITIIDDDIKAEFDDKKISENEVNLIIDELLEKALETNKEKMLSSGFTEI